MQQPQIRLIAATNDTATLPTIQFGGSEANGTGTGIRGTELTMALSVTAADVLSISATAVTLGTGVSLTLPAKTANTIFAGPTTGAAAAPAFRALVQADIAPILKTFTSAAGAGGAATEAMTVTGLLSTDTILAVTQKTVGANGLAMVGYTTLANNALTVVWHADPGAGSVVIVTVMR